MVNHSSLRMLSMDIMVDVMDEIRRERKVLMAIEDANYVQKYVRIDLERKDVAESADLESGIPDEEDPEVTAVREAKNQFRTSMVDKLSLLKLDYTFKCIDSLNDDTADNKATMLDPQKFNERREAIEAEDRRLTELGLHDDPDSLMYQRILSEGKVEARAASADEVNKKAEPLVVVE